MKVEIPAAVEPPSLILCNPKYPHNVASAVRNCSCFGFRQVWWTGDRVTLDVELGERLPREERMKGYRDVRQCPFPTPFGRIARGTTVVGVELCKGAYSLTEFDHPDDAVYVFGPEDGSIPKTARMNCHRFVFIPSRHCLNLSNAVGIVMYDRLAKRVAAGKEPVPVLKEVLNETRGMIGVNGWDGK